MEKYLNLKIVASEVLEAKLQSTIERETDFLRIVRTDKGEEFILHIEFQSNNETNMVYRMKEYNAIIQRRHKLAIRHYVIYLGPGKVTMQTQLEKKHVFRQFEVLSLNQLNFDEMLQSQIPEEIILAILSDFKGIDPEKIIRLIVEKLKKYSKDDAELKKFTEQLSVLSNLRTLEKETIKIIEDMPITFNIEESYSYRLGRAKGIEEERKKTEEERRRAEAERRKTEAERRKTEAERRRADAERRTFIIIMLDEGFSVEQIAKRSNIPPEIIVEIQQELD